MSKKDRALCLITAILAAAAFAQWTYLVKQGALYAFDQSVQSVVFAWRCDLLTKIGVALEYAGHWPLPALVSIIFLIIKDTRKSYGLPLAGCVLTSVGLYELLKNIIQRARPDEALWLCPEHGYSFPSGHTLNNSVFWIVLASLIGYYYINKGKSLPIYVSHGKHSKHSAGAPTSAYPKSGFGAFLLRLLLIIWPLIIAVSRIYVGVHWPSDVAGSLLLMPVIINTAKLILFRGEVINEDSNRQ